jgi:hypothetical protein
MNTSAKEHEEAILPYTQVWSLPIGISSHGKTPKSTLALTASTLARKGKSCSVYR